MNADMAAEWTEGADKFGEDYAIPSSGGLKSGLSAFDSDPADMEIVRKKQEADMALETTLREKASDEEQKKKARIEKGALELQEALKYTYPSQNH